MTPADLWRRIESDGTYRAHVHAQMQEELARHCAKQGRESECPIERAVWGVLVEILEGDTDEHDVLDYLVTREDTDAALAAIYALDEADEAVDRGRIREVEALIDAISYVSVVVAPNRTREWVRAVLASAASTCRTARGDL